MDRQYRGTDGRRAGWRVDDDPRCWPPDDIERLREALGTAGYTSAGIADRIGPAAVEAVRRNDFRALLRATTGPRPPGHADPDLHRRPGEPADAVAAALAPLPLDRRLPPRAWSSRRRRGRGRAGVDLDVYGDADPTGGSCPMWTPPRPAPAAARRTTCWASATRPRRWPARRSGARSAPALDLGTGCGVQALHLSRPRAVGHRDRHLRAGAAVRRHHGRAQRPGLGAARRRPARAGGRAALRPRREQPTVRRRPRVDPVRVPRLRPGRRRHLRRTRRRRAGPAGRGRHAAVPGQLAARDRRGLARAGARLGRRAPAATPGSSSATSPTRSTTSNLWLRDAVASRSTRPRREAWLDWFDEQRVEAVGFGVVTVRRSGRADPVVRVEELTQTVEPPLGVRRSRRGSTGRTGCAAAPGRRLRAAARRVPAARTATCG